MIRINLLEETRTQAKAKGGGIAMPEVQVAENVPVIMLLGLALLAIGAVAAWWSWNAGVIGNLDEKIKEAEAEKARLERILRRNEELEAMRADLNRKIDVIAELKANQAVPVQLLDQISRNLADHVWLEGVSFTPDRQLTVDGLAQTPLAVSNFLRKLEVSTWFDAVEMGRVQQQGDLTDFNLKAVFTPPRPELPGGADSASAGGSAGGRPAPARGRR